MKNMKRFAQTATEYLIILAVVIIIALIVVGVLGGIPGIGGSAGTQATSAYWSTSRLGVTAAISAGDGADTIVIKNNLPYQITVNDIEMGATATTLADLNITSQVLASGASYTFSRSTMAGMLGNFTTCTASATYALNLRINYTEGPTGASQSFSGDGNRIQGICAN